jgi:lipoteichoic acid synthase
MVKVICFLEKNIKELRKDNFFITAAAGTLLENIFFILLLSDSTATKINIKAAIWGVPPVLVYIAFVLLPYSFGFLFKGIGQRIFLIVMNLLLSLLLIFDLWYYRSNGTFLNYYMFDMTENLQGLSSSILALLRPVDFTFLITSFVLVLMLYRNYKTYKAHRVDLNKFLLLFLVPILYLTYAHFKIDKYDKGYVYQYLFRRTWSLNVTMYNLSPLGYHLYDYYSYIEDKKPYTLSQEEEKKIDYFFSTKEKKLPANKYASIFKGKNLLVIQVESLENFVINEKVNSQEITPNLNKLLKNSFYFSNYYEQTLNGTTSDATFVSNASLFPSLVGAINMNYPYNAYNSLPKLLKQEGYNTYSMHGEKGTYWNWKVAERNLGIESTLDISEFEHDEFLGLGLSDRSMLAQSVAKIEKQKEPYYSFMITLSSHTPFSIPREDVTINLPDNLKGTKTGGYIESINYTDAMIGLFMEEFDKKGLLENTVVALYGDHEGIHKYFDDEIQRLGVPDKWKYNDRRVPLIIYTKGLDETVVTTNGGQIDFLPTISSLFGINEDKYVNTAIGRNLLNTNMDYAVLTNWSYRGKEIPEEEKEIYIDILEISNLIIKTDYFKWRY